MLNKFESVFKNKKVSENVKQGLLIGVVSTLLHEYTHYGTGGADFEKEDMGYRFEQDAYGFDIQPDDINYIMNIFSIKTKGYFIDSEGKKNNFPENLIDKFVITTLPKDE